jgi:hypothetical protein
MIDLPDEWDDNPEWTEEDFRKARPTADLLGAPIAKALTRRSGSLSQYLASQRDWATRARLAA